MITQTTFPPVLSQFGNIRSLSQASQFGIGFAVSQDGVIYSDGTTWSSVPAVQRYNNKTKPPVSSIGLAIINDKLYYSDGTIRTIVHTLYSYSALPVASSTEIGYALYDNKLWYSNGATWNQISGSVPSYTTLPNPRDVGVSHGIHNNQLHFSDGFTWTTYNSLPTYTTEPVVSTTGSLIVVNGGLFKSNGTNWVVLDAASITNSNLDADLNAIANLPGNVGYLKKK